jgi:hypothetical protein
MIQIGDLPTSALSRERAGSRNYTGGDPEDRSGIECLVFTGEDMMSPLQSAYMRTFLFWKEHSGAP